MLSDATGATVVGQTAPQSAAESAAQLAQQPAPFFSQSQPIHDNQHQESPAPEPQPGDRTLLNSRIFDDNLDTVRIVVRKFTLLSNQCCNSDIERDCYSWSTIRRISGSGDSF